jgi:hypothetical protein
MDGIQLVRLLDVLQVTSISNAIGVSPRSIRVKGTDFRAVEQVLINSIASPEFIVFSETELIAQVPPEIEDAIITDVAVMSGTLTMTERSLVEFTFGTRPKRARGPLRLMQTFLRILLRSPGSNRFHPRSGGGMLMRVGGTLNRQAAADIQIAIDNAKHYIINVQTQERNLPPSERLLSAEITGLTIDPRGTSVFVTIVLTSHSGARGAATIAA